MYGVVIERVSERGVWQRNKIPGAVHDAIVRGLLWMQMRIPGRR